MEDLSFLWERLSTLVIDYGLAILGAAAIFFVGRWLAGVLRRTLERLLASRDVDRTLITFAVTLIYWGTMAVVSIAALQRLGFPTTSAVAVLGALTLAIGFALQDSLGNFAAGVMIIIFQPFRVGELIEAADAFGVVKAVQIFNTILMTPDNKTVILPNGQVLGDKIVNHTRDGKIRIDMVFGIGYEDDLLKAKAILLKILTEDERVLSEPAPSVNVLELADSSVNFAVRPWVDPKDYWDVFFAVTEQVKLRLDDAGISIPYPQTDVHLYQSAS